MKRNILIYAIDDSEFQLKVLEKGILNYSSDIFNLELKSFTGFCDLHSAILDQAPDCFIIDLVMPYVSGIYVLNFLEKFYDNIPRFINSSCNGEEYRIMAEYRYNVPFLDKESSVKERIDIIVEYLMQKEVQDDNICS